MQYIIRDHEHDYNQYINLLIYVLQINNYLLIINHLTGSLCCTVKLHVYLKQPPFSDKFCYIATAKMNTLIDKKRTPFWIWETPLGLEAHECSMTNKISTEYVQEV